MRSTVAPPDQWQVLGATLNAWRWVRRPAVVAVCSLNRVLSLCRVANVSLLDIQHIPSFYDHVRSMLGFKDLVVVPKSL